ncbi:hypothetical protein [Arthrobacter zhaoguopingii]|uniref:hypothetical protein n=1 Tax=Arthrobacter zhaoguopingii TaxID=2681491 RepID=UPI0013577F92|nr:hypothetical protein [Arthrobacter zhaoguopingii]
MAALLEQVLEANGGLDRWKSLNGFTARITYGGPFWGFKGQPDVVGTDLVEANLQEQRTRHTQEGTGRVVEYDRKADRVTITAADGTLIEELNNPRASFEGYTHETQWTLAQMYYFRSYATWHYLVEPYIFTWPGVETQEVEPWTENGETWRVLSVTFPSSIDTHTTTQLYYFDAAGRLRRMDYQPEVNGNSPVAHYIRGEAEVNGLSIPTKRHIHIRNNDRTPDLSWVPIEIDLSDIKIA